MTLQLIKNRTIQDKLIFLQNNIQPLMKQNHRLKDQLIKKSIQNANMAQSIINEFKKLNIAELNKEYEDNPIQIIRKYVILMDKEIKQKIKQLQKGDKKIKQKQELIRQKQNKILQIQNKLKKNEEKYKQKQKSELQEHNKNLKEKIQQKKFLQKNIQELKLKLNEKCKQINEIHQTYDLQIKNIKKEQNIGKQQLQRQIHNLRQRIQKNRQNFEQSKKSMILSHIGSLNMKKQQNEKLVQIINGLTNNQNIDIKESLNMVLYRQKLQKELDQLKIRLIQRQQRIEQFEDRIQMNNKQYNELNVLYKKKGEQNDRLKNKVNELRINRQKSDNKIIRLEQSIQNYRRQKQESNEIFGQRWQHEIQKVILDHERKTYITIQKYKQKRQMQFQLQKQKLMLAIQHKNNQILQLQQKLKTQIKNKQIYIKKINNHQLDIICIKKLYQQNQIHLQNQIHKQLKQIQSFKNIQQTHLQTIKSKNIHIQTLNHSLSQQISKFQAYHLQVSYQKQSIHQSYSQQISQIIKTKQHQRLQTFKNISEKYLHQISNLKINYQQQIQNITISRQLIKKRLNQQIQQLKISHQQAIQLIKKQHQQATWNMENSLRQQKISKILIQQQHAFQIKQLHQKIFNQSRDRQQHIATKNKLDNTIRNLNDYIVSLQIKIKQGISDLNNSNKQIKNLQNVVANKQKQIEQLKKQIKGWKKKYDNIKTDIVLAKQQMRKQHNQLNLKNQKLVHFYKQKIKSLQQYIVKTPHQQYFIKQIQDLKNINQQLISNLAKNQAELINVRQTQKYHQLKIQDMKLKQMMNKTQRKLRVHTTDNESVADTALNKSFYYTKYSQVKKKNNRKYKIVQNNYTTKPLNINNYSLLKNNAKEFRLKSFDKSTHNLTVSQQI